MNFESSEALVSQLPVGSCELPFEIPGAEREGSGADAVENKAGKILGDYHVEIVHGAFQIPKERESEYMSDGRNRSTRDGKIGSVTSRAEV